MNFENELNYMKNKVQKAEKNIEALILSSRSPVKFNTLIDSAIDVIQKGTEPFDVTFFKKRSEKLWRFDICVVKPGYEIVVTAALEDINPKYRTIIFVLENPEQQENLIAPCDYCFAWKENGEYHFYKEVR